MTDKSEILAAIAEAVGMITPIAHDARNEHDRYDYTSVDAILRMTGPICAKCGLFINLREDEIEHIERKGKYGPSYWTRTTFFATVYHKSGQTLDLGERSVEVIRNGPQAAQAAQSFAMKTVLRFLFQIPTGEISDRVEDYGLKGSKPEDNKSGLQQAREDAVADGMANNSQAKRGLTKARGEAILAEIAGCDTEEAFYEYCDTLEPHEREHPKIAPEIAKKTDFFFGAFSG